MNRHNRPPFSREIKLNAESKRQAAIAEACSNAIDALLDDTGPLAALPEDIRAAIRGDIDSAVSTLSRVQEAAEARSQELFDALQDLKPWP